MSVLFSVILPTLNAANDLPRCLASLQRQSYQNFEVCVVDGASSDRTLGIVADFAGHIGKDRLKCHSEPDAGVFEAMNKGIALSQGDWLYFLGADDELCDANVFADVAGVLAAGSEDIVYGDVIQKSDGRRYCGPSSWHRLLLDRNVCHQAVFYRRSVMERMGRFDVQYPTWSDWELNIRCFRDSEINPRWIDRTIAVYNNLSGVSCRPDPVLSERLPGKVMRFMLGRLYLFGNTLLPSAKSGNHP